MSDKIRKEPEFVELDEIIVVGYQSLISMKHNLIPKLWQRFIARELEIADVSIENVGLGVSHSMEKVKTGGEEGEPVEYQFFHLVGLPVSKVDGLLPEGMTWKKIPAHKYAKFTHKGKLDTLGETYNYIYVIWMAESEYSYDDKAVEFEWYDSRFDIESEDSELDIYVPII